jgi:hypothetical protein
MVNVKILEAAGGPYARQSDGKLFEVGSTGEFPPHEALGLFEAGFGEQVEDAPAPAPTAKKGS